MLLLVRGHSWDPSWRWALGSGCVLVVVGSDVLPPVLQLQPWTHFIPAKDDLSDLRERVEYALHHPDADAIATAAMQLFAQLRSPGYAASSLTELFARIVDEEANQGRQHPTCERTSILAETVTDLTVACS